MKPASALFARTILALIALSFLGGFSAQAQVSNYVDSFDGPSLDPGWNLLDPDNHVGFNGSGQYVIEKTGYLEWAFDGTGDFTADVSMQMDGLTAQTFEIKYRFWAAKFIEVVVNPNDDTIRVFSGELGANFGTASGLGLTDGSTLRLRLLSEAATGKVKIGYAVGTDDLKLLGSATGLVDFAPPRLDVGIQFSSGPPIATPAVWLDQFQIQDQLIPINFATFEDTFDGPALDASWVEIQSQAGDHVGFVSGGRYEVQKTTTSGEAGLSRDFGGQGDFVSVVEFQMQDFIGSDSRVEFRHPVSGGGITVVLDSDGDIRVDSEELAATVADLAGFDYQDGETLEFTVTTDGGNAITEIGLRRNGGASARLASIEGLSLFTPSSSELVVIKSGAGNGSSPRMQVDQYFLDEGFAAVVVETIVDFFSGPALDLAWRPDDTGSGSLVGFNRRGQYEISPSGSGVEAGIRRFIGFDGSVTVELRARLDAFMGTDAELRFELLGGDGLTVILGSDDSIQVVSDERGSISVDNGTSLGMSDGDLVILSITINGETGDFEVGLGINADPAWVTGDFGLANLEPTQANIEVAQTGAGTGTPPSVLVDQYTALEGFVPIPEPVDPFIDNFDVLAFGWNATGIEHVGPTGTGTYEIIVRTNDTVALSRLLGPEFAGAGSFVAELELHILDFADINSQTDFKWLFLGGNNVEIVFNSFRNIRVFAANNGGTLDQAPIGFVDGDTVKLRFIYDASTLTIGVTMWLNDEEAPVYEFSQSGILGFAAQLMDIRGFRFGFNNPEATARYHLDHIEVSPGLAGVPPGEVTLGPSYDGLLELTWDLGALRTAPEIDGTYMDVPAATSPYLTDPDQASEFFRAEN